MAPRRSTRGNAASATAAEAAAEERPAAAVRTAAVGVPAASAARINNNNNSNSSNSNNNRVVVRDRQRAVAEREAARLARPERRPAAPALAHADKSKSAVSSTPSGVVATLRRTSNNKKSNAAGGSAGAETATHEEKEEEEWCGPFSVARQLIAKREEARRLREAEDEEEGTLTMNHPLDAAMQELEMEKKRKAHPAMQWKGSFAKEQRGTGTSATFYSKRQKRADILQQGRSVVPSLFDLCVKYLVENFEHVESLGCDMDSDIRTAICNQLVSAQLLHGPSFAVIAETGIEALEVSDCSGFTEEELSARLRELIPAGLRYLVLDQCGRCFSANAVAAIVSTARGDTNSTTTNNTTNNLFALSIGGAYSLQDVDAALLVKSTAAASLEFKACNLLGRATCSSICDTYSNYGTNTITPDSKMLIELALEDIPLTEEDLQALMAKPAALRNLKSLSLRRIDGLNDSTVTTLIGMTASTLEGLDLTENHQLTDEVLAGIRLHDARRLHSLTLSGLKLLTAAGLEAFFTFVDGASPPPMLRTLSLGKCDHEAVTDDVLHLATQAATQNRELSPDQPQQQQQQGNVALLGGMVHLDVQGSSQLTDAAMEYLAATSSRTLKQLNVSFCTKITDQGMGYLVDNCGKQLSKVHVWGNAQLTDDFLDGNHRASDPSLEIVGVWMKKNTSRTMR